MKRTRFAALLVCLCLLAGLGSGCTRVQGTPISEAPSLEGFTEIPVRTSEPASETPPVTEVPTEVPTEPETEVSTEPQEAEISLSWQKAFRMNTLPEGYVTRDVIAFYEPRVSEDPVIHNVPKEEVYAFQAERLPRSHYYEQFLSDAVREELIPVLDYALAHRYSRFSIPTTTLNRGLVHEDSGYLVSTYRINGGGVGSLDVQTFQLETGENLSFLLVTLSGMDARGMLDKFLEGYAAAEAIVDSVPADYDAYQTALYLYRYLTDNVTYYDGDYYAETSRNYLYDSLVTHATVCSGYAEALYYLYNLAGIDCITISGYISTLRNGADVGGGHIWNIAELDGKYYQFDATWDAGMSVADYSFFAVSDAYMLANHTEYETTNQISKLRPACEEDLFPEMDNSLWSDLAGRTILWHYRFLNAMEEDPMRLFSFFSTASLPDSARSYTQEEEDGWMRTTVNAADYYQLLLYEYNFDMATYYMMQYFRIDGSTISYPLREAQPDLYRVSGAQEQEDGTWLVSLYVLSSDGSFTPVEQTVTLEEHEGYYYVKAVE